MKNVATMIERARKRAGYSKSEAARRCGMARQNYGTVESGKWNPQLETLDHIAKALGCRLHIELVPRGEKASR